MVTPSGSPARTVSKVLAGSLSAIASTSFDRKRHQKEAAGQPERVCVVVDHKLLLSYCRGVSREGKSAGKTGA